MRSSFLCITLLLAACGGGGGGNDVPVGAPGGGAAGGVGGTPVGGGGSSAGGGSFDFDTGIGGSGGLIGTISGFGSVIVNSREMESDSADFYIEGVAGSESDLREGQRVVVVGDIGNLEADEVHYRSNIKGPVSAAPVIEDISVARATLRVLGQTVRTNAETIMHGVDLATLTSGDLLEVSGAVNAAGEVIATYLERKSALTEFKATGVVSNLNSGATIFDLGTLQVNYNSASFSDFDGAALGNGQRVEVKLDPADFTAPDTAVARQVELLPTPVIGEGAEVEVEGLIDSFVSPAEFRVNGVPVTADGNTRYDDGSAASLALNVKVEVEGVANASGIIVAEEIEIKQTKAIRVEGVVTNVDLANQSLTTALGLTVSVRPYTELEDDSSAGADPLTLQDLVANVDRVEIRGNLQGSVIVAVELDREDADPQALLRGPVTAFDAVNGTVQILGLGVLIADGVTSYRDEDDDSITRTEFFGALQAGDAVSARWNNFLALTDPVDQLSLEEED